MSEFLKSLRHYWDGDSYVKLYEKAISTENIYLPVRLGPGNAKLAAARLNEILGEDFLKGNGVEASRAENRAVVAQRAAGLMASEPALRQLMEHESQIVKTSIAIGRLTRGCSGLAPWGRLGTRR